MLRKTVYTEDSDQSLSENEELGPDWSESCIPLGETAERKWGIQIQSQFEALRDSYEIAHGTESTNLLNKGQTGFSSGDEVEVPLFQNNYNFTNSLGNESVNFNNERVSHQKLGSQIPDEACTWSAINKEAEALAHLTENAKSFSTHLGSSYTKKPHKGSRGKPKPKLLFRFQSHREDASSALKKLKGFNCNTNENLIVEPMIEERTIEQLDNYGDQTEPTFRCGYANRSMVDLLDSYQDRNDVLIENTELMVDDGSVSIVGQRKLDYEEPLEDLKSGSSSDNELCLPTNVQNLGIIVLNSEQKTMSAKFEEVFGVVTANEEGSEASHGIGVFGKLQQVMQSEKKREMEFLKRLQTCDNSKEEMRYVDVEILSRCLEAKLIVCRCSLGQEKEHSHTEENSHVVNNTLVRVITVIFSPRVCDDVELETGNLIRIYSPWKEVQVEERNEMIILSTFFSQI